MLDDAPTAEVATTLRARVGTITLDRPPVNALATTTWRALGRALDDLAGDPGCSVVVVRSGRPGIFSAGADIGELPMAPEDDEARQRLVWSVLDRFLRAPVPVVAAVDGPALGGGCALAAAADIVVATGRARFGLPEIRVGRCGGASHLLRHLPPGVVRRASFTGEPIEASDAHRWGLVAQLVDGDGGALDGAVEALAATIAAQSPTAVRLAKQALDLAEGLPTSTGYAVEQQFSLRLARHPDAAEAAAAFREQRAPRWSSDA